MKHYQSPDFEVEYISLMKKEYDLSELEVQILDLLCRFPTLTVPGVASLLKMKAIDVMVVMLNPKWLVAYTVCHPSNELTLFYSPEKLLERWKCEDLIVPAHRKLALAELTVKKAMVRKRKRAKK